MDWKKLLKESENLSREEICEKADSLADREIKMSQKQEAEVKALLPDYQISIEDLAKTPFDLRAKAIPGLAFELIRRQATIITKLLPNGELGDKEFEDYVSNTALDTMTLVSFYGHDNGAVKDMLDESDAALHKIVALVGRSKETCH